jgi:probable HAF family extracellular repeat protein
MQDLGDLGGGFSSASGINIKGQVVGISRTNLGDGHIERAFLWQSGQGMKDLGTLGGDNSGAAAINDKGQVVGESQTSSGDFHAVLWP